MFHTSSPTTCTSCRKPDPSDLDFLVPYNVAQHVVLRIRHLVALEKLGWRLEHDMKRQLVMVRKYREAYT